MVCRQLGFRGAVAALSGIQGPAGMPLWLDNVNCTGRESTLLECQSTRWGNYIPNQCTRSEFAGVTCKSRSESVLFDTRQVTVDEQDDATYQVWLEKAPTADVTVAITGTASTDVTVSPASLTFTTANWKVRQTVTVSAANDSDMTDDTVEFSHDPSGGGYDSAATKKVTVTVKDNDDKGVSIDPTTLNIDEGNSTGGSYSMVLTGRPSASVTVTVTVPPGTDVAVSPASLTFTASNWNAAQTVSVTAAGDDDRQPDSATLTHGASGGGYGNVAIAAVAVQVRDTDRAAYLVPTVRIDDGGIITVREGGSDTYNVSLTMDPIGTATVTVDAPPELSVSRNTLSFDLSNWSQPQTVTIEAPQDDSDTSDERLLIRHTITEGNRSASVDSTQVWVTDDDDGEALVGARPADALWWAALTARSETGGAVGFIDYTSSSDTGKLSDNTFVLRGVTRRIEGLFIQGGTLQVWVDSGDGFQLPNNLVLHVGTEALTLGSASTQSFETTYNGGSTPTMRDHTYRWLLGAHSVSLSDRRVVAVWLEDPSGTYLPAEPRSVRATAKDSAVELAWTAPPEVPSKPVRHYEYQKNNSDEWTATDGPETTTEVDGLVNGDTYKFRLRAVNDAGKGAASAPSKPVTPTEPGLTAEFGSVPSSHDGSTAFTLRVEFSEAISTGFRNMRDHAFEVTGGTVTRARRAERGSNIGWRITVEPDTDGDVVVSLPARACEESGAVCTADDRPLQEAVSATVPGPASVLPEVSVAAGSSPVTEGSDAVFTLTRAGDTSAELTVALSVTEDGAVVSGTLPATVTFAAGSAEARLGIATEDDGVTEADGRVTASVSAGSGYTVASGAGAAGVDVYDNDEVVSTTVETLWRTTLEWQGDYGNGWVNADAEDFSSPDWSEDGDACRIWYMAYGSASGELWLRVNSDLCAGGIPEPETLALHLGDVTVGPGDALSTFARGGIGVATGVEADWTAGERVEVRLTRTEAGEAVASGPGLSVEDAQVQEAEGAALAFRVTLDAAHTSTVSVRYATSDGTASAGADYEAVTGALRFAPGETAKTVSVRVLNDTHDEGSETLSLSRPFGADISDGEAVGTIVNTGPMPRAWITRFGRTVALQAVEAIGDRMSGARGTQVVVGGVALGGSGKLTGAGLDDEASWPAGAPSLERSGLSGVERGMTGRELLLGSAFQLEAAGEDGDRSWSAWGRFATSGFDGEEAGASLSGDVTTGFLGADLSVERWLAGLALGVSEGEGAFDDGAGGARGTVQSSLASVYPYARLSVGDGTDVWGLAGIGSGDLTLRVGEEVTETGLSMRMGALGVRSELVPGAQTGAFALALKSDALWVRTDSDAARTSTGGKLEAASGGASRLRAALEGSRSFAVGLEATFTPTVELGLRHDGGDAETGTGVEVGVGLQYADPARGLTIGGSVRGLLAHSDDGYEEWGASGSIRLDPGTTGRGLSLSITPVWGAASGGVETLWSARTASGLTGAGGFEGAARLEAEMGYGFALAENAGVLTPYMGLGAGEDGRREYRIGTRWHAGSHASVSLDVSREEVRGTGTATDALMLRAALRF